MHSAPVYYFNPHALPVFLTGILALLFGVFTFLKNKQSIINRAFLYTCVSASVWLLATAMGLLCKDETFATLWFKIDNFGVCFIPINVYYFVVSFLELRAEKKRFVILGYAIASFLGIAIFSTDLLVSGVQRFFWGYFPKWGILSIPFLLFFFCYVFASILTLFKSLSRQPYQLKRNQTKYILLAYIIAYTGSVDYLPTFGINVYPFGYISIIIFLGIVAYSIITTRLMNINLAIKNTLIYAGIYSMAVGLFVLLVVFFGQLLFYGTKAIDKRVLWMGIFALLFVVAVVRPLDKFLTKITDKFLFQKKYEYQETLKEAAKGMASITDINKLFKLIVHFLTMRVRVAHCDLFYFDEKINRYTVRASRGKGKLPVGVKISKTSPLAEWLLEKREILIASELDTWLRHEKLFPNKTVLRKSLEDIRHEAERLGASLVIPCFIKDKLVGFLILGEKLSGDIYTDDDVEVLSMLTHEAAVAFENAQLYQEIYEKMEEIKQMYEREKKLFVSTAIAFANAIDAKDAYTHGHTERVTKYCLAIGHELRKMQGGMLRDDFEATLHLSALLHDVGKIGTPDNILNKKGALTRAEYDEIKKHPIIGASILYPIKELNKVALAIKYHQERFDGKGYPDGIKGEEIPLEARIIMVADTFDAMITDRPYRPRVMEQIAVKEIEQGAGTQFDPLIVSAFMQAYKKGEIIKIRDSAENISVADVYINSKLADDPDNGNNSDNKGEGNAATG